MNERARDLELFDGDRKKRGTNEQLEKKSLLNLKQTKRRRGGERERK